MLLQTTKTLEEMIVLSLGKSPGATAQELETQIASDFERFTLRAIYKDLRKLIKQGIVVKIEDRHYLRLTWVKRLIDFLDEVDQAYSNPTILAGQIATEEKNVKWKFSNLSQLDLAWTQLVLALHERNEGRRLYLWAPFRFFHLVHSRDPEAQIHNRRYAIVKGSAFKNIERHHMYGKDCFLARMGLEAIPEKTKYHFAPGPFRELRNKYYSLIADFVVTVTIDEKTINRIDQLYSTVHSEQDLKYAEVSAILNARVRASMVWEENPDKARKLRKKFEDYFGLPPERSYQ